MQRYVSILAAVIFCMQLWGCAGKSDSQSFMRENVDLGFYERIAILPFDNQSQEVHAAERLRDITSTQVLALGLFDIVDKGIVDSVLLNEAINKGDPMSKTTLARIGKLLNVKALLLGTVDHAGESRRGSFAYPEISLTLRLIDAGTSTVLWQASGHRSGYSLAGRLFGLEPRDAFQVSMDLVEDLLSTGM